VNSANPLQSKQLSHLELVRAAVLAPSPDNNQPWRFTSHGDQLFVYLDPSRALPSDVNAMCDLIGLGAALENIRIAAAQLGYEPCVEYSDAPAAAIQEGLEPAARLTFQAGGRPDPLFAHLATRCTCRKRYGTQRVAEDSLNRLAKAACEFPDVRLDWIIDRPRIRAFAGLIAVSDRVRFEYEPFHHEVFRQLRFSAEEAARTRDGLDVRTLELPPGAAILLRQLRPWTRMKWLLRLGLGRLLTLPSAWSVRKSGALGVLTVSAPTSEQFLQGGRVFQRIWLTAQAEGLSLQPLGSLAVFIAHVQLLHGRKLSQKHVRQLADLMERFQGLIPAARDRTLLVAFRTGTSEAPQVRALRRPAEEVCESL
jgi:nitroreductase